MPINDGPLETSYHQPTRKVTMFRLKYPSVSAVGTYALSIFEAAAV